MASSLAPGREDRGTPRSFKLGYVGVGDDPRRRRPGRRPGPAFGQLGRASRGHERQVGARQQGQPDGIGVLLDHRLDHLFGRLVEAGVDNLESGCRQGRGNHLAPGRARPGRAWPRPPCRDASSGSQDTGRAPGGRQMAPVTGPVSRAQRRDRAIPGGRPARAPWTRPAAHRPPSARRCDDRPRSGPGLPSWIGRRGRRAIR